jgi:hypothetical protein
MPGRQRRCVGGNRRYSRKNRDVIAGRLGCRSAAGRHGAGTRLEVTWRMRHEGNGGVRQVGLGDQCWQLQASIGARIARRRQVACGHRECRRRSQRRCRVGGLSPTCTSIARLRHSLESGHRQGWLPVLMREGSLSPGHKEPSPRARSARWAASQGIRAAGAPKGGLAGEARARCAKVDRGDTAHAWHKEPQRRRGP